MGVVEKMGAARTTVSFPVLLILATYRASGGCREGSEMDCVLNGVCKGAAASVIQDGRERDATS